MMDMVTVGFKGVVTFTDAFEHHAGDIHQGNHHGRDAHQQHTTGEADGGETRHTDQQETQQIT